MEVLLHLIISIGVVACLQTFIEYKKITSTKRILFICIASCFIIGLFLFPTTMLSERTPALVSIPAWTYWLIGHSLYGGVVGYLVSNK